MEKTDTIKQVEKDGFMLYLHPDFLKEKDNVTGKRVFHSSPSVLESMVGQLAFLIGRGIVPEIKFKLAPNDLNGPFSNLEPPICVYLSEENKARVYQEFARVVGARAGEIYWQSEEATKEFYEINRNGRI